MVALTWIVLGEMEAGSEDKEAEEKQTEGLSFYTP